MNLNQSNLYEEKEARDLLKMGIDGVANAVKKTLGYKGSNAILQDMGKPGHLVTNDGISIANRIHFKDPVAEMGANIIRSIAQRADDKSGDGTTTATVLGQAIINEGMKHLDIVRGIEIKRELEALLPELEKMVDEQSKPCETIEDIRAIARISSESKEMADIIAEIYQTIGKNNVIEVDNAGSPTTVWEEIKGVRFLGARLASSAFAENGKVAIQENPLIFVTTQPIRDPLQLKGLFTSMQQQGRADCVLVLDEIEDKVLSFILKTNIEGNCRVLIAKAPNIMKDAFFEDIIVATSATMLNAKSGVLLEKATIDNAGTCEKITITMDSLTIRGGNNLDDYSQGLEATLDPETPLLKERLACLSARHAILKIGVISEENLSYQKAKSLDCVNSVANAVKGGMVCGGGVTLLNLANQLTNDSVGHKIMREALKEPLKQIIRNCGWNPSTKEESSKPKNVCIEVEADFGETKGWDAKTNDISDMEKAGIMDSTIIVKNSLKSAMSVAGTILSADIVTILPEAKQMIMMQPPTH